MAAPQNKPIGYQISVIVMALTIVILATVVYMDVKKHAELQKAQTTSETNRQKVEAEFKKRDDEYRDLRTLTGNLQEDHGLGEDDNVAKQRGATMFDVRKAGLSAPPFTTKAAIDKLVQQTDSLSKERDALNTELKTLQGQFLALQNQHKSEVGVADTGRKAAEKDLQDLIGKKDEEVRSKQKQIDELRVTINEVQTELDNEKLSRAQAEKKLGEEIQLLTAINDKLRLKIDEITKTSFEVPNGEIRWVDNQNGLVWINLGEADNLPKRLTFSVYNKKHNGVARGSDDIKGAIEITRIIDAHTAEARITRDDLYRPIAKGDPIFTPVWSAGRKENFSFVGVIDLDNDGKSDRQQLHELIASAGAAIDNEVDDTGKRIRYVRFPGESVEHDENTPGIDVNTKFLVICKIPEIAEAVKEEDKERIERMLKQYKAMQKEAVQQGVRIVRLNDFLTWIGYEPQRRLWVPGGQKEYELKAGQRKAPIDDVGRVSGAISGNKRLKPQSANNAVSPLMKGGAK